MSPVLRALLDHQSALRACTRCPGMTGPVVTCTPTLSRILLVGQAPGDKEPRLGRPFAWTAGKTLFKWFEPLGLDEKEFRAQVYMAAVCRCFPGKNPKGGDRVPDAVEIDNCLGWLRAEVELLGPELLLPVGKLAIARFMQVDRLADVVGRVHRCTVFDRALDVVPLPHPSGLSTWHRMSPGKALLEEALACIDAHPAWRRAVSLSQTANTAADQPL
jgi:uracil-DNA glycosylase